MPLIVCLIGLIIGFSLRSKVNNVIDFKCKWINYYPWIQAVVYLLLFFKFNVSLDLIKYSFLICLLIPLAIIDQYTRYIYVLPIIIGGGVALLLASFNGNLLEVVLGGMIGFITISIIMKLSNEGLGEGDRDLITLCGLFLGLRATGFMIILSFVIGALVTVYLSLRRRISLSDELAFAPFICIATMITVLFQDELINIYVKMLHYLI